MARILCAYNVWYLMHSEKDKGNHVNKLVLSVLFFLLIGNVSATTQKEQIVPMHYKGTETYYVYADIDGVVSSEFMVDTGSGFVVLSQESLDRLKKEAKVHYVKQVLGKMADGSQRKVSIWKVGEINLGGVCSIKNVEVAVFPGNQRQIIGLRALKRAAPFTFQFDPPQLKLSACEITAS